MVAGSKMKQHPAIQKKKTKKLKEFVKKRNWKKYKSKAVLESIVQLKGNEYH